MVNRIKRNAARCTICSTVVEVTVQDPIGSCICGALKVAGGLTYARHYGKPKDIESLVEYEPIVVNQDSDSELLS